MSADDPLPLLRWGNAMAAIAATAFRKRRRLVVETQLVALTAIAMSAILAPAPRLVWNASASSPTGLYWVTPGTGAGRGDRVVAWLPAGARALAEARHYVPASVPVVKSVAAVTGSRVCAVGGSLTIDGRLAARILPRDSRGRAMPRWHGCLTLGPRQILLLGDRPESFDGRYFGPSLESQLIGQARLIWGA